MSYERKASGGLRGGTGASDCKIENVQASAAKSLAGSKKCAIAGGNG